MPIQQVQLDFSNINVSAQIGDDIYVTIGGSSLGGFNEGDVVNTKFFGKIISISGNTIIVQYNSSLVTPPVLGDYISFAKNKKVNTTSLLGYYAHVELVNNSGCEIELFSVGSEVTESSK